MPGQLLAQKSIHIIRASCNLSFFFNYFSRMTQQGKFEYYLPAKNPSTIGIQSIFSLLAGLEKQNPTQTFSLI
jgi:thiaminase